MSPISALTTDYDIDALKADAKQASDETKAKKKAMTEEEIRALEHDFHGPTWKKDDEGNWILPERTVGWHIVRWCSEYLLNEEGGRWKFTLEQLRFVLWWYAVDESGRYVYRKGVLQRMKGWG